MVGYCLVELGHLLADTSDQGSSRRWPAFEARASCQRGYGAPVSGVAKDTHELVPTEFDDDAVAAAPSTEAPGLPVRAGIGLSSGLFLVFPFLSMVVSEGLTWFSLYIIFLVGWWMPRACLLATLPTSHKPLDSSATFKELLQAHREYADFVSSAPEPRVRARKQMDLQQRRQALIDARTDVIAPGWMVVLNLFAFFLMLGGGLLMLMGDNWLHWGASIAATLSGAGCAMILPRLLLPRHVSLKERWLSSHTDIVRYHQHLADADESEERRAGQLTLAEAPAEGTLAFSSVQKLGRAPARLNDPDDPGPAV